MSINWSSEYRKFEEEQAQIKKECLVAGMTEQQIDKIYKFSKKQLNRDCAFWRRTQPLDTGEDDFEEETRSSLLKKHSDVLSCTMQIDPLHDHWWIEELENEKLAKAIKKLSEEEIVAIELHVISNMTQAEAAVCLGITQAAFSQKFSKIREKIRNYVFRL